MRLFAALICSFLIFSTSPKWAISGEAGEVIHWWISGSEAAALNVIADAFEKQGYQWIDTSVETSYHAKTAALSRILDANPPLMMQWHAGVSLKELWKENMLQDINTIAKKQRWQEKIPAQLWQQITIENNIVAVPVTLHGSNWMWGNRKILNKLGITPPDSWDDFLTAAPKIKEAGIIPLAIGGQAWQERILFLNVALATGGPEFYTQAFVNHNPDTLASQTMANAFATFGRLKDFTDKDSPGRNWSDTTALVISGKAAFQVMGDWAKGEFVQAGLKPGIDFSCTASPGTSGNYIMISDVFAMAKVSAPEQKKLQSKLAEIIMSPSVQRDFNLIKGSIPPRTDVAPQSFDSCSQKAMKTIAIPGSTLPGFDMANTGIMANSIMNVIHHFWVNGGKPTDAARALAEAVKNSAI